MSTRAAAPTRSRPAAAKPRRQPTKARRQPTKARRRQLLRRRLAFLGAVIAAVVVVMGVTSPWLDRAVQEIRLPLSHADVIRAQAEDKDLDPSLIAGVIYAESRFRDQTSAAGAKGLMQIMPDTADYIARKSGGTAFEQGDLATPRINIAYGSWYLRHLLDKYDDDEALALAAYNGGQGNVDRWIAEARSRGEELQVPEGIPFKETRDYVTRVLTARDEYREQYARELGL